MLEKIREGSQGFIAKAILGIVILTFALAGIGSYLGNTAAQPAATVNGEDISQTAFEQKYQSNRARMEQQFGQMFAQLSADDAYMKTFREGVLDQLINEELQTQLAQSIGLRTSDEKIKKLIREMPEFQVDGQFDNERYLLMLRQVGYQPSSFRDYLQVETTRRQVAQAIATTDFSLPSEAIAHTELDKQTRDIEFIVFKQSDFTDKVAITDEDSKHYYDENFESFKTQEMLSLQYVEIKIEDLMKDIAVSDEQLQSYYNDNISNYRTNVARRRASHILVEFGDDETAAKVKAEALLVRVNAGEDFAEVAKNSDDTFSGDKGGDLDWFEMGVMGDEFDTAAFALANINDVSDLVRSDSGYHIIKLTGDEPEATKAFADVKEEVASTFKRTQANDIFSDKQASLEELSYEVPDSLEDAAGAIGSNIQETALFSRMSAPPVVNFPKVIQAAFSQQVLTDALNSEVIEINADHVMVVRLLKHEPTRIRTQEEVATQIMSTLIREKSQEMAKMQADELLAKLDGSTKLAIDDNSKSMTIVAKEALERFTSDVDSNVRTDVFKMPKPQKDKVTTGVYEMSNGDYALVALSGVTIGKVPEDLKATEERLASQKSQRSYKDFIESLKEKAEIVKLTTVSSTQQ
jgi:peptidyl-prolyl cis-trans isomerase D